LDDYLSEAEQWEWLKGQIREYGPWIVAGIVLGAAGIGGWLAWQSHTDGAARAASAQYEQLRKAFGSSDRGQAMLQLGDLERDHPSSPYVDQARLMAARAFVDAGQLDKAVGELKKVTDGSRDHELALLARLRLARVQIAQGKPDEALATLANVEAGAFEPRYHEVRGDAYYAKGDKSKALQEYRSARMSDIAGGGDHALLDLKISDLLAEATPASAVKPAVPGATPVPAATPAPAK
jgi:predicted negative regulator of RcsB-dependent stress response